MGDLVLKSFFKIGGPVGFGVMFGGRRAPGRRALEECKHYYLSLSESITSGIIFTFFPGRSIAPPRPLQWIWRFCYIGEPRAFCARGRVSANGRPETVLAGRCCIIT